MILLTSTSDALSVITSSTATTSVHASWLDLSSGGTVTAGRTNTAITTATTTTIVASPGASTTRNVKTIIISNDHASTSNTITLRHTDGTTVALLESVILAPGERLSYSEGRGLRVVDPRGAERTPSTTLGPGFGANVTANAADTYVAGFNIYGRVQQFSAIHWRMAVSKTGAGVAAPIFTFRTGTAGTTSDTSRVALTSPFAQTGVADTGTIDAYTVIRTFSSTGVIASGYTLAHALAATGLGTQPAYGQSGVSAAFDLTTTNLLVGLSVNPGTAGVWTIDCAGFATNLIA